MVIGPYLCPNPSIISSIVVSAAMSGLCRNKSQDKHKERCKYDVHGSFSTVTLQVKSLLKLQVETLNLNLKVTRRQKEGAEQLSNLTLGRKGQLLLRPVYSENCDPATGPG